MAAYEQRDLLPTYAEFTDNVCEDAGEGFSRLGETMPRRSEIWPQPMGHHVFLWRISHATGNEHFALCRNTFGDAPYGAAVYSVNPSEATGWYIWRRIGIRCSAIRWLAGCTV